VYLPTHRNRPIPSTGADWVRDDAFFTGVKDQLQAYFNGRSSTFDIPLSPAGTGFQVDVWKALTEIPFGGSWTYGELAQRLGKPRASRAVGLAVGRNPVSIIIPCHRVLGSKGQLTGYAGGLEAKKWLLHHELEGAAAKRQNREIIDAEPVRVVPMTPAQGVRSLAAVSARG
jgi:methylated-DNA-[protein]-cysteine S-methyltransferase